MISQCRRAWRILSPVLLALLGVLAPATASASLPSWTEARPLDSQLRGQTALLADAEIKTPAPHEHGPFCPHSLQPKTRVRGFDLELHCDLGGEAGLTCRSRPAYALGYGGHAVERSVFTGYLWDQESKLFFAKARFYDPTVGRFTSQDSFLGEINNPPSLHRYMYAADRPTFYTDPTGHCFGMFELCDAAVASVVDQSRNTNFAGSYAGTTLGEGINIGLHAGIEFFGNAVALPGNIRSGMANLITPGGKEYWSGNDSIGQAGPYREAQRLALDQAGNADLTPLERGLNAAAAVLSTPAVIIEEAGVAPVMAVPGQAAAVGTHLAEAENASGLDAAVAYLRATEQAAAAAGTLLGVATGAKSFTAAAEPRGVPNDFIGPRIGRSGYITSQEFADASYQRYQGFVDEGHQRAVAAENQGLLRGNPNTRVGDFVDRFSASEYRSWLGTEGISEGPGEMVSMNRWLRDSSGSGLYTRPDIRIPGTRTILDATVGWKDPTNTQILRFGQFSGGDRITVVRPEAVGGSYSIR